MKSEFNFINVGKFFAMFCVVMMHTIRENSDPIFKLVQIGCMAYFFFVSGFLFNFEDNMSAIKYILKNLRKLGVAYFVCSAIGILFVHIWPEWYAGATVNTIFESIFINFSPMGFSLVWFIAVLFTIKVVFYILWSIIRLIKNKKIITICFLIIAIVLALLAQILISYYKLDMPRLNFKLDCSVVALIFYIFGFLFRYWGLQKIFKSKIISLILFIITRALCSYIEIKYIPTKTNIIDFIFGNNFYIWFINQLIAVLSFMALGSVLKDIKILYYLGRHNLYIYLSHAMILWVVEELYGKYITGEVIYNFYDLKEILLISIITYVITIIFSVGLECVIRCIKNKLSKIFV